MTRTIGRAAALLAACAAFAIHTAAQTWRGPALASFDETWQTIHDTFYDPSFGGVDWDAVKRELRPRVESAASMDEARAVIRDMLTRLKRSHFALLTASPTDVVAGPAIAPIEIRLAGRDVVITRLTDPSAAKAGAAAGQILVAVSSQRVADLVNRAEGSDDRTRDLDAWRRVTQTLYGLEGSSLTLTVRTVSGETREIEVHRRLESGDLVTLGNLPPLRVRVDTSDLRTPGGRKAGVIAFTYWMTAISDPIEHAIDRFRQYDGLVLDLRGNPGGLAGMMMGIAGHMIAEPVVLGTMQMRQAKLNFPVNPRLVTSDGRSVKPFAGPVAILVDELTGSTSETFAGSLQSLGRARVFGRLTMGQAMPALTHTLPNGDVLLHVVGDFVTSTGKSLEGPGVIPDVLVPLSPRALAGGRDEALDAALGWIDQKGKG